MNEDYKHPKWQKKRLQILERDGWKCLACGDAESLLHVHHCAYDGKPWEVDDALLQTLCESCHAKLGEHPKAGVWWYRRHDASHAIVHIHWCPICKGIDFAHKGSYYKCRGCQWRSDIYSEYGHELDSGCVLVDRIEEKKPKTYSLNWLKQMMTKVRKGGATDAQICDAVFPESPLLDRVSQFRALLKLLADRNEQGLGVLDEIAICAKLIEARAAIEMVLDCGEKNVGTLESIVPEWFRPEFSAMAGCDQQPSEVGKGTDGQ